MEHSAKTYFEFETPRPYRSAVEAAEIARSYRIEPSKLVRLLDGQDKQSGTLTERLQQAIATHPERVRLAAETLEVLTKRLSPPEIVAWFHQPLDEDAKDGLTPFELLADPDSSRKLLLNHAVDTLEHQ